MKSWQTTALGILGLIVAIGSFGVAVLDGDPSTTPDFEVILTALSVAGVGWFARDNNKSSEDVGTR